MVGSLQREWNTTVWPPQGQIDPKLSIPKLSGETRACHPQWKNPILPKVNSWSYTRYGRSRKATHPQPQADEIRRGGWGQWVPQRTSGRPLVRDPLPCCWGWSWVWGLPNLLLPLFLDPWPLATEPSSQMRGSSWSILRLLTVLIGWKPLSSLWAWRGKTHSLAQRLLAMCGYLVGRLTLSSKQRGINIRGRQKHGPRVTKVSKHRGI